MVLVLFWGDEMTTKIKVERTLKGSTETFVDYPIEHPGDSECAPGFRELEARACESVGDIRIPSRPPQ